MEEQFLYINEISRPEGKPLLSKVFFYFPMKKFWEKRYV
jgi:hypothetical protein